MKIKNFLKYIQNCYHTAYKNIETFWIFLGLNLHNLAGQENEKDTILIFIYITPGILQHNYQLC